MGLKEFLIDLLFGNPYPEPQPAPEPEPPIQPRTLTRFEEAAHQFYEMCQQYLRSHASHEDSPSTAEWRLRRPRPTRPKLDAYYNRPYVMEPYFDEWGEVEGFARRYLDQAEIDQLVAQIVVADWIRWMGFMYFTDIIT